jgi:hypothetical protein
MSDLELLTQAEIKVLALADTGKRYCDLHIFKSPEKVYYLRPLANNCFQVITSYRNPLQVGDRSDGCPETY